MNSKTWDIPTRNAKALRYLAQKREQAQKRHIRLTRNRKRITGVMVSRLGLMAVMAFISIGAFLLVTLFNLILRG